MRTCLAAILLLAFGCSPADPLAQRTFETPEAAARALGEALERDDQDALLVILGREYEDQFITSDWDNRKWVAGAYWRGDTGQRLVFELQDLGTEYKLVDVWGAYDLEFAAILGLTTRPEGLNCVLTK